jgi:hypothetical protein
MEIEPESAIPFLDVLIIRKETTLATKVSRKPTHIGRYLSFRVNHPSYAKIGLVQSLHNKTSTIRQEWQYLVKEISNLISDFQLNRYPQGFIDSVINSKGSSRPNAEDNRLGSMCIPYVKGVSEKLKRIGNQ